MYIIVCVNLHSLEGTSSNQPPESTASSDGSLSTVKPTGQQATPRVSDHTPKTDGTSLTCDHIKAW